MEEQLHVFLPSALVKVSGYLHALATLPLGKTLVPTELKSG
jgi:hypothetical protein